MSIEEILRKVEDPRGLQGRKYRLSSLLYVIVYGLCAGRVSAESIRRFTSAALPAYALRRLGFSRSFPCARTLRNAMRCVCPQTLERAARVFAGESASVLHADGKTLRGAKAPGGKAAHVVNLYDGASGAVSQRVCTGGAGGEKAALALVLREENVSGALITADAGFTPGETPARIFLAKAHYLLRVKDNTPVLKETMRLRLRQQGTRRGETAEETVLSGGKHDTRHITVLPAAAPSARPFRADYATPNASALSKKRRCINAPET